MMGYSYGCVVDAGSSGSRIFLYRWPKQKDGPTEEVFNEEITPGISDPEHGLAALQELVTLARKALPQYHGGNINENKRLAAYLRLYVSRQVGKSHQWREEGIYDWLTINYMKNGGALPDRLSPTYGALDLGGASTQISFNEARAKHSRHIAATNKSNSNNPCYPVGYVDEITNLNGSSNWDECLLSVSQLFDPANCVDDGESCFDSASLTQLASHEEKFVATSAFVFAWDFLQLKTGANTDDLATLNKQAKQICNMEFSQQLRHYRQYKRRSNGSSVRTTTKPHAQCFNAAYSYHLLSAGYSMPITNTPIEVNDIKSWTLGMMLVEANNLTKISNGELYSNLLYSYEYVFAGSTLVLMLLTSLVWRRKRRQVHYLPHVTKSQAL
ncbi:GDA1/CD39 NTPase family protein [Skeletonema marinoi]|uniref:GDA1/CD39 NTPase family protein n=1 Tax=Skeletonema marinoi TaxID=267567 RepID=A0AAD8XXM2_9STRA|nr:GDA1/CD39 NTPase family protein [Skeletonema marinoi]